MVGFFLLSISDVRSLVAFGLQFGGANEAPGPQWVGAFCAGLRTTTTISHGDGRVHSKVRKRLLVSMYRLGTDFPRRLDEFLKATVHSGGGLVVNLDQFLIRFALVLFWVMLCCGRLLSP